MTEEVLGTRRLSKRFKGFTAVDNVDLSVRKGHIHALIGPNGAGKTTLFNMISGFLDADSGTVEIKGKDGKWHKPSSPADFATLGVGRTFQIVQPFAAMTVEENIMVGAFHRYPHVEDARAAARRTAEK